MDGLSLDVYLPGESEAVEMHYVETHVLESGTPVRRELLVGDSFPLGNYFFHVHVDDEAYKFMWGRSNDSMNVLSLSCLGRQEDDGDGAEASTVSSEALTPVDSTAEESTERAATESHVETDDVFFLESDQGHAIFEEKCVSALESNAEKTINLSIAAVGRGELAIGVFLPGETESFRLDDSSEHSLSLGESASVQSELSDSVEFPSGRYLFHAHINENTYQFQWQREDQDGQTFGLTYFHSVVVDDDPLKDEENIYIPGTPCLVWTEARDVDFNIIVIGENQDGISVDLYFPGLSRPAEMESFSNGEFEDGTPYRVEWISGDRLPLGPFNIDVTIDGEHYPYQWEREDYGVNAFGVECLTLEDE